MSLCSKAARKRRGKGKKVEKKKKTGQFMKAWMFLRSVRAGQNGKRGETEALTARCHNEPSVVQKLHFEEYFKIITFCSLRRRSAVMLGEGLLLPPD